MSNCSNHKRDVLGQTDMRHLAEDIGNLHYQSLASLLYFLSDKLYTDGRKDFNAGRTKLAQHLFEAQKTVHRSHQHIDMAYRISEPFMKQPLPTPPDVTDKK